MYTSYVVTILLSMCMNYVSLTWLDFIPYTTKGVIASDYHPAMNSVKPGRVATQMRGITHRSVCQCLNHREKLQ